MRQYEEFHCFTTSTNNRLQEWRIRAGNRCFGNISGDTDNIDDWDYGDNDRCEENTYWETNDVECEDCSGSKLEAIDSFSDLIKLIKDMETVAVENILEDYKTELKSMFGDKYNEFISECTLRLL